MTTSLISLAEVRAEMAIASGACIKEICSIRRMMDVDEEVVDETQLSSKEEGNVDWKKALPENAGGVCDISNQACWTLSSCKTDGFGIHQLLEENVDQYWQSDGPQPHTVTIEFPKKTDISFLLLYLDYKTDESYTPSKVVVHLGSSILDMDEGLAVMFSEPVGWQVIDVRSNGRPARAFVLQLHVVQNHQNGRDTHIRQMKVVGPARTRFDTDVRSLLATGVDASNIPATFTSSRMAFFSSVR
uniref:Anaphase-promoting complex subunit 10 n=2 Tax=Ascaris suum TaxID=6253 RepID=F1KXM7_ASCSU